jgi:hypothetical protein
LLAALRVDPEEGSAQTLLERIRVVQKDRRPALNKELMQFIQPEYEPFICSHLQTLQASRATRMILCIQQYKENTGQLPTSLGQLECEEQVRMDPIREAPFVYRLVAEDDGGPDFELLSGELPKATSRTAAGGKSYCDVPVTYWPYRGQ